MSGLNAARARQLGDGPDWGVRIGGNASVPLVMTKTAAEAYANGWNDALANTGQPWPDTAAELEALADDMQNVIDDPAASGIEREVLHVFAAQARRRASVLRAAAPDADRWEQVAADQVRVGDDVEADVVHGDASATVRGNITSITPESIVIGDCFKFFRGHVTGVRRRVRPLMPEPEAPAVVRHSGRILARSEYMSHATQWLILSGGLEHGDGQSRSGRWLSWAEVLALDPAADPVVVPLGGGA